MPIRIIFFGTPAIATGILQSCIDDSRIDVVAVVAQPDRVGGRGRQMLEPETKKLAIQHRIPCHQPEKIRKNKEFHATLEQYGADYFVVCAYGKILPKVVLDIPKKHCLNIHFSDLPEYRGMAPVQFALLDGIDRTAIAIQIMAEGMDEGDVVATLSVEIGMFDTTGTLFARCGELAGPFFVETLHGLHSGVLVPTPQDHTQATYTSRIEKEHGLLDPHKPVQENFSRWKAYTPWPGLYFELNDKKVIVEQCSFVHGKQSRHVGQVVELESHLDFPLPGEMHRPKKIFGIIHPDGVLILLQVKPEGKKSMLADAFWQGYARFF